MLGMGSRMLTLTLALILTPTLTLTLPHPHLSPFTLTLTLPYPNPTAACALWNGLYSVGSVIGPLASASLYAHIGWLATTELITVLCAAL